MKSALCSSEYIICLRNANICLDSSWFMRVNVLRDFTFTERQKSKQKGNAKAATREELL